MSREPGRGARRALAGVLLALVLAGPGQAAVGATASAAAGTGVVPGEEDALRLSADGATWTPGLPASLFGSDALAVPGATVVRDLWVRNDGPTAARVLVDLAPDVDPTAARTGLGAWLDVRLDGAVPGAATWEGPVLDPGEVGRVEVSVAMSATAPSSTRRSVAGVLETVHLVGVADAAPPTVPGEPPSTGPGLARTGADAWGIAVAAALAAGAGLVLARLGRRRAASSGGR
ncbi:hypothetical protein JOE63_001334 [Cellulosimicrobium cellulans]|uniref:hypothetical protein n=1 Tax=Cellulosimicrobium cellulans TaxID=1710 RepID=UPI00195C9B9A|nr:hypothetical protein [Cellulosimicrobium cellulans]MBM7818857.1 hypothetical protein [Cellulosimicrobium cellulans]